MRSAACPSHRGRAPTCWPAPAANALPCGGNSAWIHPDDRVGSPRGRDRALGGGPERQAGHPQRGRLLLNAAGVREDDGGTLHQAHEIEIRQGLQQAEALHGGGPGRERVEPTPRARVNGEDDGNLRAHLGNGVSITWMISTRVP
jgi:hypothetical protein